MVDKQDTTPAALPTVAEDNLEQVPGVQKGTRISLEKIDPKTGAVLPSRDMSGTLAAWNENKGWAKKKMALYVMTAHEEQLAKKHPGSEIIPTHTSGIDRIRRMSDGSYWLTTESGSTYRLRIAPNGATAAPADSETGDTTAGGGRLQVRGQAGEVLGEDA